MKGELLELNPWHRITPPLHTKGSQLQRQSGAVSALGMDYREYLENSWLERIHHVNKKPDYNGY